MQGIGMALTENITRNAQGGVRENSLMQYKIRPGLTMDI